MDCMNLSVNSLMNMRYVNNAYDIYVIFTISELGLMIGFNASYRKAGIESARCA